MALSGSFTGTTSNPSIVPKIVWSGVQSHSGKYTDVTATLYYSRTDTWRTEGTWTGSITIGGTTTNGSKYIAITYNSNTMALSATVRVQHDVDGSKTITISASGSNAYPSSLTSTTISQSITLDQIPVPSAVSALDTNIGSNTTIIIAPASKQFTHTLTYKFGDLTGTIATKTADTKIYWKVPTAFYEKIPNSPSGECVITCTTYNGANTTGTSTATFVAHADKTICSPSVSVTSVVADKESIMLTNSNKKIISGISTLSVVTKATAKNSASIKTISVYCGAEKQTGADVMFSGANSAAVYVIVTDSRGYSTRVDDDSLSLINYIAPTMIPSVSRVTPTGDTVIVSVQGKWFNGSFGSVTNTLTITVRRKGPSDSGYHTSVNVPITKKGNDYSGTVTLTGIDYTKPYSFLLRLDDAVYTDANGYRDAKYATVPLSKGIPVFDWGENDFQFNVPVTFAAGYIDPTMVADVEPADFVLEKGTSGNWTYRKWNSGISEAWYSNTPSPLGFTTNIASGIYSNDTFSNVLVNMPSGIFALAPTGSSINAASNVVMMGQIASISTSQLSYRLWTSYSTTPSRIHVQIYVFGRWKQ